MKNSIVITAELPSLNEYIRCERANRYSAAAIKKSNTDICCMYTKKAMFLGVKFNFPCYLKFTWFLKNKRKDPDNVSFAKKFVLDGMMKAGMLEVDNISNIFGFVDNFYIDDKNPRVVITEIQQQNNP